MSTQFRTYTASLDGLSFRIEEDVPEVGWYLYVYERDKCIRDSLQNTFEDCRALAFAEYNVPLLIWHDVTDVAPHAAAQVHARMDWGLDSIRGLQDSMDKDALQQLFGEVLEQVNLTDDAKAMCLNELAIRFWHTYEPCSDDLARRVDRWIIQVLPSINEPDVMEAVFGIIGSLGLGMSYSYAKGLGPDTFSTGVAKVLIENTKTSTEEISDPYRSLR